MIPAFDRSAYTKVHKKNKKKQCNTMALFIKKNFSRSVLPASCQKLQ